MDVITRDALLGDPATVYRHRRLAELVGFSAGDRLVDLGCGDGVTLALSDAVQAGHAGLAVGLDLDPEALAAGTALHSLPAADGRLSFVLADLRQPLPLGDQSIDRVVCHNVLEQLPLPDVLLDEAHRVLRPGGRFVLSHSDFDTMVFAGADDRLTRRIVDAYCHLEQDWMNAVDGTIGRRLPTVVARSSFRLLEVTASVVLSRGFSRGMLGYGYAHHVVESLSPTGLFDRAELDDWLATLADADMHGGFLFSVNDYAVVCET
jgi:SAM-dependent methyltransferase